MSAAKLPAVAPHNPPAHRVRVMICDDSPVIRGAIANILQEDAGIEVVARVGNGRAAVDTLRHTEVDVLVLDIEMPVMDGLTALPLILEAAPGISVIMASTLTERGAEVSMRALRLGAADYLPKPQANAVGGDTRFAQELIAKVRGLARLRRGRAEERPGSASPALRLRPAALLPPRLLAIGSSTGGPNALFALVHALGAPAGIPVVITQHMPKTFTAILAQHIDRLGIMPCAEARDGEPLLPGRIALAPGDRHLLIRQRGGIFLAQLSDAAPENFCRPAVDPMLRSAAGAAGGRVLAVMLTGMGHDGLEGARQVVEAGGTLLAQDEASSVVWGMPGAVARAGLAHAVLPLQGLAAKILALSGDAPGRPAPAARRAKFGEMQP